MSIVTWLALSCMYSTGSNASFRVSRNRISLECNASSISIGCVAEADSNARCSLTTLGAVCLVMICRSIANVPVCRCVENCWSNTDNILACAAMAQTPQLITSLRQFCGRPHFVGSSTNRLHCARGSFRSISHASPTRRIDTAALEDPCKFYVTCNPGLEETVAQTLASPDVGAHNVSLGKAGVYCTGSMRVGYAANLWYKNTCLIFQHAARSIDPPPIGYAARSACCCWLLTMTCMAPTTSTNSSKLPPIGPPSSHRNAHFP